MHVSSWFWPELEHENSRLTNKLNVHNNLCQRFPPRSPNPRVHQCQTNQRVDSFSNQMDARMGTIASMLIRALMKCLRCGSEFHNLQACTRPRRQQSSRSDVKPRRRLMPNPKAKPLTLKDMSGEERNQKASRKAREARLSLQPRVGMSISTTTPRLTKMTKMKHRLMMNLKKMIQKLARLQLLLPVLKATWNQTECSAGPQANARTTMSVWQQWHALHQIPSRHIRIRWNGVELVV